MAEGETRLCAFLSPALAPLKLVAFVVISGKCLAVLLFLTVI